MISGSAVGWPGVACGALGLPRVAGGSLGWSRVAWGSLGWLEGWPGIAHSISVSLFLTVVLIYPLIVETSPGIVHMNLFCMMGAHVLFPGGPLFFCPADDSSINC